MENKFFTRGARVCDLRESRGKLQIDIRPRTQNYCQKLMRSRQRCDTVALLIFIKRARALAVSFRIIPPPRQAHNENKISCLNFTGIITKRWRCHAAEKYGRGVMTDIRAQTSSGDGGKKWEKQKTFLCEPRQLPLLSVGKTRNSKMHLCLPRGRTEHNRDVAYTTALTVGIAESHVTHLPARSIRDSKFRELFIRNCATRYRRRKRERERARFIFLYK